MRKCYPRELLPSVTLVMGATDNWHYIIIIVLENMVFKHGIDVISYSFEVLFHIFSGRMAINDK